MLQTADQPVSHRKVLIFTAPYLESEDTSDQLTWKISQFDIDHSTSQLSPCAGDCDVVVSESDIDLDYDLEAARDSILIYLDSIENTTQQFRTDQNEGGSHDIGSGTTSMTVAPTTQDEYNIALEESEKLLEESQGFSLLSTEEQETGTVSENGTISIENNNSLVPSLPMTLTKLSHCIEHHKRVNIFAVVLQMNLVREIKVKSGDFVKISSLLVGDETREYFKLTFWRNFADWTRNVNIGDVIFVKNIKIARWKDEFYGEISNTTSFVNLKQGRLDKNIPAHWLLFVNKVEAESLMQWLKEHHGYITTQKKRISSEVKWQTLSKFQGNSLVHYKCIIVKVLTYNSLKGSYHFGQRTLNKVIAVAVDLEMKREVPIFLWGHEARWQYEMKRNIGHIYHFSFLRVEYCIDDNEFVLHTTPQSTLIKSEQTNTSGSEYEHFTRLSDLLKANFNGKVSVNVDIHSLKHGDITIDNRSDSYSMQHFLNQMIYLGCKSCLRPLEQDCNGIYTQCISCMKNHSSFSFGVMYCYKQCELLLCDLSARIVANINHLSMVNILENLNVSEINEGMLTTELVPQIHKLFTKKQVKLICETKLDENGFVREQHFELVDIVIIK